MSSFKIGEVKDSRVQTRSKFSASIKPVLKQKEDTINLLNKFDSSYIKTATGPFKDLIVLNLKKKLTQTTDMMKQLSQDNQVLKKEAVQLKQ